MQTLREFLRRISAKQVGLATQFTAFAATLVIALACLLVVLQNFDVRRSDRELLERKLDLLVSSLDEITYGVGEGSINHVIALTLRQMDLDGIVSNYGYVGASDNSINSAVNELYAQSVASKSPVFHDVDGVLHVAAPIVRDGSVSGLVYFDAALGEIESSGSYGVSRNIFIVLAFLMLAVPLIAVFMSQITEPVRRLVLALRGSANGEADMSRVSHRNDEIGDLARAFVEMQERLKTSAEITNRLMTTDEMTGLPNREALRGHMASALDRGMHFALFVVNIDRLGQLNIDLGSDTGDKVIAAAGAQLESALRDFQPMVERTPIALALPADRFLARFGSDEFAILFPGTEVGEEAAEMAAQIIGAFRNPLIVDGRPVAVTLSIGIALAPADGQDSSTLKRNAHLALYDAKAQGPGHFSFARSDLTARADRRLAIEHELRLALERNELVVYYQPQVDLRDGAFIGAEALVRWQHPVRGLVGPVEFIDIAEEAGLIEQLGTHVLNVVSRQIAAWADRGLFPKVAVNVSASQCMRPDFCASVFEVLSLSGAPTTSLQIELTETVAMRDPIRTARELAPLRAAGVRMAIDDFGTGYSNLATITRLPFDVLKIDRSFISECARDGAARVVVATILNMAQNLGYQTVAEGVETEVQREFLLRYGCTFAQGYLFGKPVPAEDFESMFVKHRRTDARNLQEHVRSAV